MLRKCRTVEATVSDDAFVLQPVPPRSQAAPGTSSMSVEMDAAFQRGGSVTERTTVATGPTSPSVQVHTVGCEMTLCVDV